MSFIRTFGVGLLVSAALMLKWMPDFIAWFAGYAPHSELVPTLRSLSTETLAGGAVNGYGPVVYTLICCGAGFFIAGVVYPVLEGLVTQQVWGCRSTPMRSAGASMMSKAKSA